METITYDQVHELIGRLPEKKLPIAYNLLVHLSRGTSSSTSPQHEFLLLPLAERRRIMAEQADRLIVHYEETSSERREWQAGDFVEY